MLAQPPAEELRVVPSWWTLERRLYAALALAALAVRLLWLGKRPLTPAEAHHAWLAWHNTQPLRHAFVEGVSPLGYTLQWVLFLVTSGGDGLARFWPALAGGALVLLPYGLRHRIGQERALLTAALLAFSAQATYWGRNATGVGLALAASLAVVVALVAWLDEKDVERVGTRLVTLAVTLALLLMTDAGAYTVLLGLLVGSWALWPQMARAWDAAGGVARRRAVAAFGLTVVVLGTVFLTDIPALGNVGDLPGVWLARFWTWSGYPWYWFPFRLVADEPLVTGLALFGAWFAWQRRDDLDRLWLGWAGAALLFGLVQPGRAPGDVALLVIPLAFLAADALWRAVQVVRQPSPTWREELVLAGAFLVILTFWFMMMAGYIRTEESQYIPALLVVPILVGGLAVLYGFWLGRQAAVRVVLVVFLLTGATWSWMAMWVQNLHLATDAALDALPGIEHTVTHPDVRLMVQTLERISAQASVDLHEVRVDAVLSPGDDLLRWYLRDFRNLEEKSAVQAVTAPVVITHFGDPEPQGYTGMDWTVIVTNLPTGLGKGLWHWWFYREAPLPETRGRVLMWYKGK